MSSEEILDLVALGKRRGLIKGGAGAAVVEKNGIDAAELGKVRSQWMAVTPAMAKDWMRNNFRNRPMSQDVIRAYARDMVNGTWVPTHQGIAFNDEDQLIDGQHRLEAVALSGVTVRMMVTFGLPSKIKGREMTTMDAVDRGRPRSVGDQLLIQHGMQNGSMTAAICAALASLCYGERTRRLSVGQTLDVFRAFEPAVLYVIAHRSKAPGLRTTGVMAGFAFALVTEAGFWERAKAPVEKLPDSRRKPDAARRAEGEVARLYEVIHTGNGLKPESPLGKLRGFLLNEIEAKLFTRSLDRGLSELVLQTIYQELIGAKAVELDTALEGVKHFRELQKERVEKVAKMFRLPGVGARKQG